MQHQINYTKAVKAHLHIVSHYDLKKKSMSVIKMRLLQLKESHCQICLFEDMLNSYYTVIH